MTDPERLNCMLDRAIAERDRLLDELAEHFMAHPNGAVRIWADKDDLHFDPIADIRQETH